MGTSGRRTLRRPSRPGPESARTAYRGMQRTSKSPFGFKLKNRDLCRGAGRIVRIVNDGWPSDKRQPDAVCRRLACLPAFARKKLLSAILKIFAVFLSGFLSSKRKELGGRTMTDLNRQFDENVYDLNAILHPGSVFDHPRDVLADATLSRAEKRAILASWASDAAAVTSCPSLRAVPGAKRLVPIDDILEALSSLDHSPRTPPGGKPARLKSTDRVAMAA